MDLRTQAPYDRKQYYIARWSPQGSLPSTRQPPPVQKCPLSTQSTRTRTPRCILLSIRVGNITQTMHADLPVNNLFCGVRTSSWQNSIQNAGGPGKWPKEWVATSSCCRSPAGQQFVVVVGNDCYLIDKSNEGGTM